MNARITVFTALALCAGSASANFFDGFDMGNFFGNNTNGQTYGNSTSNANGNSRGRGAADINLDFDLNFRAKGFTMLNTDSRAQSRGDVAQSQNAQWNAYGTGYNTVYPYGYYYPQAYYPQQYYPQAYYLPPVR